MNKRGLKLGLWAIRGVRKAAVDKKCPIAGTKYTVDQLVDTESPGGGANGSCLWASTCLGVNMSHPAAQTYYDSYVESLASYGVDFIKADCMMCGPCYTDEVSRSSKACIHRLRVDSDQRGFLRMISEDRCRHSPAPSASTRESSC